MEDKNVIEHGFQVGSLKLEPLTFWEGVAMIVGTDIGSGVLALAYGARKAGWPVEYISSPGHSDIDLVRRIRKESQDRERIFADLAEVLFFLSLF